MAEYNLPVREERQSVAARYELRTPSNDEIQVLFPGWTDVCELADRRQALVKFLIELGSNSQYT